MKNYFKVRSKHRSHSNGDRWVSYHGSRKRFERRRNRQLRTWKKDIIGKQCEKSGTLIHLTH